jgi:hypothetical protein
VDTDTAACNLGRNDHQHPPRTVAFCFPGRSKCDLLTHRYGPRHLIRHPDSAPPHLPESPGSAVQAGAFLPWRRPARMGDQPQLYRVDDIHVGDLLVADDAACDEGHDELRRGDDGQHRPLSLVRTHAPACPSTEPSCFLSGSGTS